MKRISLLVGFVWSFLTVMAAGPQPVKLLMGGSGWNKIVIIDKHTKQVEWEHPLQRGWECNSVAATPDGNVLFSYSRGAKVVTRDHREVWNIDAPSGCEMQTARVLDNGNYLLAWNGHPAVIMEVDARGTVLSRTEYETGIKHPHSQFRQVCKADNGNYLIPLFATSEVREVTPGGQLVKTLKLEGTPFTLQRASRGVYWVGCGDGHTLVKINWKTGRILKRYAEYDVTGVRLFFVAGLHPARKKGLYVCNWQGHSAEAKQAGSPQVLELDAKGRMVWSLNDSKRFGMISSVCVFPSK